MRPESMLVSAVLIPIAGAGIVPLVGRFSKTLRNLLALVCVLASCIISFWFIPAVYSGAKITVMRQFALGVNFTLTADGLAVFMACVSSLLSAVIIIYSFDYISHYENQNEYYAMVVLFLGAMMGLVFSANLILLYIFWEITAITSWRLIGFFRQKMHVIYADKAFLVTMFGAVLMLLGFVSLYQQAGSFDLAVIGESLKVHPISNVAVACILAGILSKSATLPFHTWLPDAGVAPSPVTALLHAAILVKIGVYCYARLFIASFPLAAVWHTVVPAIAGASALIAASAALLETDLKRIIAYSTVSQIGFIFFGLAVGNELALVGALLYILMHGIAKAGLFLCAGIIEQNTKTKDITKLGGLMATMPVTAVSFLFCAFSVMGIPPFGGFFSKYLVFAGAVSGAPLWIVFVFLVGAFLTILYLFRVFNLVFLGSAQTAGKEASFVMVSVVAVLALLSLAGGIFINYPANFLQGVVAHISGIVR